jgi:inosine/xanthosine triphosphatase
LSDAEVVGVDVPSEVQDQPKTLEETTRGACNRALNAFHGERPDFSIGIESGLMKAPYTRSGYVNFCVAVVYDGQQTYLGHSTGFDLPPKIVSGLEAGDELDKAVFDQGLTDVPNIGKVEGGFLGILTKGRVTRQDFTTQALKMALIPLENKEMYAFPDDWGWLEKDDE